MVEVENRDGGPKGMDEVGGMGRRSASRGRCHHRKAKVNFCGRPWKARDAVNYRQPVRRGEMLPRRCAEGKRGGVVAMPAPMAVVLCVGSGVWRCAGRITVDCVCLCLGESGLAAPAVVEESSVSRLAGSDLSAGAYRSASSIEQQFGSTHQAFCSFVLARLFADHPCHPPRAVGTQQAHRRPHTTTVSRAPYQNTGSVHAVCRRMTHMACLASVARLPFAFKPAVVAVSSDPASERFNDICETRATSRDFLQLCHTPRELCPTLLCV